MLRNKTRPPTFALPDEAGAVRTLDELRGGGILVLLFLRFAECPTTRRDLLAYANVSGRLEALGARLAAVTADTVAGHADLCRRLEPGFPVLSDARFEASQRYGVYHSDETDEGPQPHGEPALFVVDVEGELAYSQTQTGPKGLANAAEIALVVQYMAANGGRYW